MVQGSRRGGKLGRFYPRKGYGFITPDDGGEDLFVHKSSIRSDGLRSFAVGDYVEFATEYDGPERIRAGNVTGTGSVFLTGVSSGGGYGGGGGGRVSYGGGSGWGGRCYDWFRDHGGRLAMAAVVASAAAMMMVTAARVSTIVINAAGPVSSFALAGDWVSVVVGKTAAADSSFAVARDFLG